MTESVIISVEGIQRFLGEEAQTVQIVTEGTMKTEGNTVYLSYELRFPKESVVQMTAEQRDCYQNFIIVLAQILIKYAAAEKENQKI